MEVKTKRTLHTEFKTFLLFCLLFTLMAFIFDRPAEIFAGLGRIFVQRGLLITDYMVVGGLGAAIINATLVGLYAVAVLYIMDAKPTGAALMCLWMSVGWTYWGANVLNTMPLTCGVWLYSRYKKAPFSDYVVAGLLCHAIAPMVSLFYFSNPIMLYVGAEWPLAVNVLFGIAVGLIVGFLLPSILSAMSGVHSGNTLYNMGVAGGMMAMTLAACFKGAGITVPTESMWYTERRVEIAIFLYVIFAALVLTGLFFGKSKKTNHLENYKNLLAHSGHAPNDFYSLFGDTAYINMGLMGALGTTWCLIFGLALNSGTFACIFSMVAFGCLGKHLKNVFPILTGATICKYLNLAICAKFGGTAYGIPATSLAILFSSCLAPIAGQYGFGWGLVTGFMHVLIVTHVGSVTNGFNLYNNGFASGFVAIILVPVILGLKREKQQ